MPCDHCGAFRRAEGGIKVGGTINVQVTAPCPCSDLFRVNDDAITNVDGLTDPTSSGAYLAQIYFNARFCPSESGLVIPELVDIECANYSLEDLDTELVIVVYDLYVPDCTFIGAEICTSIWDNGTATLEGNFTTTAGTGEAYYVQCYFQADSLTTPYTDPPVFNLKFEFVR